MNPFKWILSGLRDGRSLRRPAAPPVYLHLSNLTRNTVLATHMEVADSSAKRNKGLLGRESLAVGAGLWIIPCESVHTFWMRFPIDLVYLDRKNRIRKLVSDVPAWRISGCIRAHSVVELPAGTIRATLPDTSDELCFTPSLPSVTPDQDSSVTLDGSSDSAPTA